MIAYLDSSVLLRKVLRQPGALREWAAIRTGVASALAETECLRSLHPAARPFRPDPPLVRGRGKPASEILSEDRR